MTTLKILFLLPLSILYLKTSAQIDDLLKNKDITWIAETYNDFLTEAAHADKIGKEISRVTPLKFLNIKEDSREEGFVFQNILMQVVQEGKMAFYDDADCKTPLSPNALMRFDTIERESMTYERKFMVIVKVIPYDDILFFRARQVVFYDSKTAQFGLRTLTIAPMVKKLNNTGDFIGWKPLFWIKATDLPNPQKLTNDDVTWAARMVLSGGMPIKEDIEDERPIKVLKMMGDAPIIHQIKAFEENAKVPFYKIESSNPTEKFSFAERTRTLSSIDTILQIDPVTYEQKIKIVVNKMEIKDIKRLRLVQNWYWNDKKKRLEIYLVATAPLKDVKNEIGEFLYRKPLFYRRTDD